MGGSAPQAKFDEVFKWRRGVQHPCKRWTLERICSVSCVQNAKLMVVCAKPMQATAMGMFQLVGVARRAVFDPNAQHHGGVP